MVPPLSPGRDTVTGALRVSPSNSPLAYHLQACEFVSAGKVLLRVPRFVSQSMLLFGMGVELALKSFLLLKNKEPPRTHDLAQLFDLAATSGLGVKLSPQERESLAQVSAWFAATQQKGRGKRHRPCVYPIQGLLGVAVQAHVVKAVDRIVTSCRATDG